MEDAGFCSVRYSIPPTPSITVLILDGSLEYHGHVRCVKQGIDDVNKCFNQVTLPSLFHTCSTSSDLPSNIRTMPSFRTSVYRFLCTN